MQVKLDKSVDVPASANQTWEFVQDIPRLAECLPGARITEKIDDRHYNGSVTVKLGPITASFNGKIEVKGLDPQQRQLQLLGSGTDATGASTASMSLTAVVRDKGADHCELLGKSDISVSGKIANFGGRMMTQVSDQILNQFADNLRRRVGSTAEAAETPSAESKPLNALALFWRVLLDAVAGLFRRK